MLVELDMENPPTCGALTHLHSLSLIHKCPRQGGCSVRRSIGVTVFVMLSGRPPFDDDCVEYAVLDQAWSLAGPEWDGVSDQAKDFVKQLMMYNPNDRLSAEDALVHPWITGLVPEQPAWRPLGKWRPLRIRKTTFASFVSQRGGRWKKSSGRSRYS